jgi:hypothetical protein
MNEALNKYGSRATEVNSRPADFVLIVSLQSTLDAELVIELTGLTPFADRLPREVSRPCALFAMLAAFKAKIGTRMPDPALPATLPSALVILRVVLTPTITRALCVYVCHTRPVNGYLSCCHPQPVNAYTSGDREVSPDMGKVFPYRVRTRPHLSLKVPSNCVSRTLTPLTNLM